MESACDEVAAVTWQPMHAEAIGFTGLMKPCGSCTSLTPRGFACDPSTWHLAQLRVSPGPPCGLINGKRTSVKSLTLPLRPMTV